MTALDLNHRLATLLGWTNIKNVGGALLGTPPAGEPQCRNEAKVPDWAGDWRDCGPLIAEHEVNVLHWDEAVNAECPYLYCGDADVNDGDRDTSTRRAIVRAVIAKLEAGR